MSESKHTSGPWEWVPDRFRGGYSGLVGPDGAEVLFPNHANDGDEGAAWFEDFPTAADARLIAAAPDLLAACKAASEVHKLLLEAPELNMANYTEDGASALNHAVNEACCKLEAIHAAITRAEQEQ